MLHGRYATRARLGVAALAIFLVGLPAAPARADSNLIVGVDDNAFLAQPDQAVPQARALGLQTVRVVLSWDGRAGISPIEHEQIAHLVNLAPDLRVVVSTYSPYPTLAPFTAEARDRYCNYLGSVVRGFPTINDVVVWNEPNLAFFWMPQFNSDGSASSPASYEALLAHCYDVLHQIRPSVNVIAPATCPRGNDIPWAPEHRSISPGEFILGLGEAYRASARSAPLFDTFGEHIYGTTATERPWKVHDSTTAITEGDYRKLMDALTQAFAGTGQPLPGECRDSSCVSIWYLEAGFQTEVPPAKSRSYVGSENMSTLPAAGGPPDPLVPDPESPAPDQATQLEDAVRLAFCQPYVGAFFNFLLWDEPDRSGWQSGVFWSDRTPKGFYAAFQNVIGEVRNNAVDCTALRHRTGELPTLEVGGRSAPSTLAAAIGTLPSTGFGQGAIGPIELTLAVPKRVRARFKVRARLIFSQPVVGEEVQLQRRRRGTFATMLRRTVTGRTPTLTFRLPAAGRWHIRVAYASGLVTRYTQPVRITAVAAASRKST